MKELQRPIRYAGTPDPMFSLRSRRMAVCIFGLLGWLLLAKSLGFLRFLNIPVLPDMGFSSFGQGFYTIAFWVIVLALMIPVWIGGFMVFALMTEALGWAYEDIWNIADSKFEGKQQAAVRVMLILFFAWMSPFILALLASMIHHYD